MKKRTRTGINFPAALAFKALVSVCLVPLVSGQIQAPVTPQPGQATTRTIQGVVTDSQKVPVPDAVVLLKDTKTLQVRSYLAQKDGRYNFIGLSSDVNYELRAQEGDRTSKPRVVSVFDSHKVVTLNLKLDRKKK